MASKKYFFVTLFSLAYFSSSFSGDFSIGRRIITKPKMWSQQEFIMYTQLEDGDITTFSPSIAYGISQEFGFQISLPIIVHEKHNDQNFHGIGNMSILGQWQFYQQPSNLGVLTAGVIASTRNFERVPKEILPPSSYTFEFSYIHSSDDWFAQINIEYLVTPKEGLRDINHVILYYVGGGPKLHYKNSALFTTLSVRGTETTRGVSRLFVGPQLAYIQDILTIGGTLEWPIMQNLDTGLTPIEWFLAFLIQIDF